MDEYTVIYTQIVGYSHTHIPCMERIQLQENETLLQALDRLDIYSSVFIFEGWPKLEGEDEING